MDGGGRHDEQDHNGIEILKAVELGISFLVHVQLQYRRPNVGTLREDARIRSSLCRHYHRHDPHGCDCFLCTLLLVVVVLVQTSDYICIL